MFRVFYQFSAVKSIWSVLQTYKQNIKHSFFWYSFISVFSGLLVLLNIAISVCFTAIPFVWCCMICLRCVCSVPSFEDTCADYCGCVYAVVYTIGGKKKLLIELILRRIHNTEKNSINLHFFPASNHYRYVNAQ